LKPKVLLSWSSGKDSAWTLHLLRQNPELEVVGLFTTVNSEFNRVAMHGVRHELVQSQAAAIGLPIWIVPLPWPCSNAEYESRTREFFETARRQGVTAVAFGDLFLRDIRGYRERQMADVGLEPLFPAWVSARETPALAREMTAAGFRATLTCVDPRQLSAEFVGREFDRQLLADLPPGVDPCGENGEFHTFCHSAPIYSRAITVRTGEIVHRDGFVYADILPAASVHS
jgi:uncharacterized protein (TIGR00290 family)